jgi:hypothetical protein
VVRIEFRMVSSIFFILNCSSFYFSISFLAQLFDM